MTPFVTVETRTGQPVAFHGNTLVPFTRVWQLKLPGGHGGLIWNRPALRPGAGRRSARDDHPGPRCHPAGIMASVRDELRQPADSLPVKTPAAFKISIRYPVQPDGCYYLEELRI